MKRITLLFFLIFFSSFLNESFSKEVFSGDNLLISPTDIDEVDCSIDENLKDNKAIDNSAITLLAGLEVQSVTPTFGTRNVAKDATIQLTFNESIDGATLNSTGILIWGDLTGPITGTWTGGGTSNITFTPTRDFNEGEVIRIEVNPALSSVSAVAATKFNSTFRVATTFLPAIASWTKTSYPFTVTTGDGDGRGGTSVDIDGPRKISLGDLSSDGTLDFGVASRFEDAIRLITSSTSSGTTNFEVLQTFPKADDARSVQLADLNNDGELDAVFASANDGKVEWRNNDGGTFSSEVIATNAGQFRDLAVGDVDGDGDLDIITVSVGNNIVRFYEHNGDYSNVVFAPSTISSNLSNPNSVTIAQLTATGNPHIIVTSYVDDRVSAYQYQNGSFVSSTHANGINGAIYTAVGDLNGDGVSEIVSAAFLGNKIFVHSFDTTTNSISAGTEIAAGLTEIQAVQLFDIDGDGDLDIIAAGAANGLIRWYENDGNAGFTAAAIDIDAAGGNPVHFVVADINDNGYPNILVADLGNDQITMYSANPGFFVTESSPAANSINISSSSTISLDFSKSLNTGTVNGTNIKVRGQQSGIIAGNWVVNGAQAAFTPSANLLPGEVIHVEVSETVLDADGEAVTPAAYSFTVLPEDNETLGQYWLPVESGVGQSNWQAVTYGEGRFVAVSRAGTNNVMYSEDGLNWTGRTVISCGYSSVTYGGGRFVGVCRTGQGRVMYSDDGETWTEGVGAVEEPSFSVTYGNGRFVAVANQHVIYSYDGVNWSAISDPEAGRWESVTYGNGRFVAVASSGTNRVMHSVDGISWTPASATEANSWLSVTYGNGRFVAVASSGANRVMHSVDGISWTAASATEANSWISVTYGNGRFIAVAESGDKVVMYSEDGVSWISALDAEANTWQSVYYGNSRFVAVASNGGVMRTFTPLELSSSSPAANAKDIAKSANIELTFNADLDNTTVNTTNIVVRGQQSGVIAGEWSVSGAVATFDPTNDLTEGEVIHVEIGTDLKGASGELTVEDDAYSFTVAPAGNETLGEIWAAASATEANIWISVTYGGGRFVAVAETGIHRVMYSDDGIAWTAASATEANRWKSVTYGDGRFVAVADDGVNQIMYSDDGVSWTTTSAAEVNSWKSITYGNGRYVAVASSGTNRVMYSDDGEIWTAASAPEEKAWGSITYGNGRFVAVSNFSTSQNQVMYSDDGISWTSASASEANQWQSVTYGNGRFVAVTNSGSNRVMYSNDGEIWTAASAPEENSWMSIAYGNGRFVAVSNASSNQNQGMYSDDGITWTAASAVEASGWRSVTYGNGRFLAVANSGTNRVMYTLDPLQLASSTPSANAKDIAKEADIVLTFDADLDNTTVNPTNIVVRGQQSGNIAGIWSVSGAVATFDPTNDLTDGEVIHVEISANVKSTDGLPFGLSKGLSFTVAPVGNENLGQNWMSHSATESNFWRSVTYGNGRFVAVSIDGTNRLMYSDDGISWTASSGVESNIWVSVTYGNGRYVAVASSGTNRVMYSDDGISWSPASASENNPWRSVTYGNGRFVAVATGGDNQVMYSEDGVLWNTASSAEPNAWRSVTYGNGRFVAVSMSGTNRVMYSDDGVSWTVALVTEGNDWSSVTYGNGRFVAVADFARTNSAMYSTDGVFWTETTVPEKNIWTSVSYGNGRFVAVSETGANRIMYSNDGIKWIKVQSLEDNSWQAITYGNGQFVAVSSDGTNRVMKTLIPMQLSSSTPTANATSIAKDANIVLTFDADLDNTTVNATNIVVRGEQSGTIAGEWSVSGAVATFDPTNDLTDGEVIHVEIGTAIKGVGGELLATAKAFSFTVLPAGNATLGQNWTTSNSAADNSWRSVTFGNGLFVAIGESGTGNRVMTSPDGIEWTSRTSAADNGWSSVTFGNGLFVAVGESGTGNRVMTSPDGIVWTSRTSAADNLWSSVTFGNGLFVAVSTSGTGNRVMTSPDGITWTSRSSSADYSWYSVTYGNGLFVAVSYSGTGNSVMTSPDGITWTTRASANDYVWYSVTYGNGLFVATALSGSGNRVMTSPDGIVWTSRTSAADNSWLSVTYGNGLFVATAISGSGNRVMTSPDGIDWTSRSSAADNNWASVTYGNGRFVAVSYSGTGNRVMRSLGETVTFSSSNLSPANNEQNVDLNASLRITFEKAVQKGTGTIEIRKSSDDQVVASIDASSNQVSISDKVASISPSDPVTNPGLVFEESTQYYFIIPGSAFVTAGGEQFEGISDKTTWTFTTASSNPTLASSTPTNNATKVSLTDSLVFKFSENITLLDASKVTISGDGSPSTAFVRVRNDSLIVGPSGLVAGVTYTAIIAAGAIENSSNDLNEEIHVSFRTLLPKLAPIAFYPGDGAVGVPLDTTLSVKFNQALFQHPEAVQVGAIDVIIDGTTYSSVVSIQDSTVTIDFNSANFVAGQSVTASVSPSILYIVNEDGLGFDEFSWTFTSKLGAPKLVRSFPANNATNISEIDEFYFVFDQDVTVADSNSELIKFSINGAEEDVFNESDLRDFEIFGDSVVFENPESFKFESDYTVTLESGLFQNASGDKNETITISFSTSLSPPSLVSTDPAFNSVLDTIPDYHYLKFDKPVQLRSTAADDSVRAEVNGTELRLKLDFGRTKSGFVNDSVVAIQSKPELYIPGATVDIFYGPTIVNEVGLFVMSSRLRYSLSSNNPELVSSTPSNNATKVSLTDSLVFKFNQNISLLDAAKVTISGDGSPSIAFVRVRNDSLILEPSGLTNGTNYTVTLASGTVENAANEVNEEIQISFTTLALLPSSPVISSTSPANGGTDATVNTNIDITFSENVLAKTGEVAIYSSSNTPIETFSANILSISGAKVTINPSSDLSFSETYYVLIDQDAFETTNGVAFAGISDDQVFRFTTAAAANNVPTASNQNFTGTLEVNQQLTGSYTYTDADSDPESGTTLQWYVADNAAGANKAPVSGANAINYTLTTSEAGKFLALGITPNDGKDAGPEAFTDYQGPVVAAVVPTIVSTVPADGAVNVSIDANLVLTLSETVTKGTGNIVLTPTSGTVTQIAVTSSDVSIAGAVVRINPTTDLLEGQFYTVIFDATAFVDADGNNSAGLSSQTAWNFTTKEANVAPVAQGVSIKKSLVVDGELQGSYTYFDDNGDAESGTVYSWYRSDDNTGTNKIAISGAATQNYTVVTADNGKYLTFEVTPSDGTLSGEASESAYFGPILINDGNINIPPAFTSDALTSIKDNETYTYTVTYEDINNDVPVLTKTTGPAWLSVTGFVLSGSPTASNIGDHQVVLTLDDQNGGTVTQAFTITVIQSNTAPSVSGVELAGTSTIDQVLTGSYNFIDAEQDTDNSTFKWYRSDDASGSNKVEITSATSTTYTLTTADADKYISFEVTPNDGTINGTTGESALLGPIGKKTPSLSLAGITKVYGDAAFDLSATTNSSGTVTYTFDNDQTGASLSGSRVTLGNVGQITVNVSLAADAEYAARTVQGTITVSKRPITFTAQNASKVYGAADPSFFSFDVTQGNLVSDAEVIRLSRDAGEAVGTYSINLSEGEGAENYDITTVSGTFTITKVPITVTAVAATKVYGDADPTFTYNITSGALITGDELSGAITRVVGNNVGTYAMESSLFNGNYDITFVSADLTITKKELTARADDKSRTYGEANPELTITYEGFVNGDDAIALGDGLPFARTTATSGSPSGTYAITLSGSDTDNYTVNLVDGTLTVGKASLTATAEDKSRTYGDANPELTITYEGFVNGDNAPALGDGLPFARTTATAGSPAGTYAITLSGSDTDNYTVNLVDGTLTVGKANLTATADDKMRNEGEENPVLTISYNGFINGDDASELDTPPSIATAATLTSDPGTYDITLSGGSDNNYALTLVNGKLTVNAVNNPPTVANAITDKTEDEGFTSNTVDLSNVFTDADSDALTYTASSSTEGVATVAVSGTTLTYTEVSVGTTTITVTANDGKGGTVNDEFTVTINAAPVNNAPTLANAITDKTEDEGFTSNTVDLSNVFADADSDALTYTASSSEVGIATVSVAGTTLTYTEVAVGSTTITVTANDGKGGTVSDDFTVTINAAPVNNAPTLANAITDKTEDEGFTSNTVDLSTVFADADSDALTYTASSAEAGIATVSVAGTTLTYTEVAVGSTTITVTANDGKGGTVNDEFTLTINAAPVNNAPTLANAITDKTEDEGFTSNTVDLSNVFADADSDALTYTASSSAEGVATVAVSGTTLTYTEVSVGTTTITVTANDGKGGTVSDEFTVTINAAPVNNPPTVANAISDKTEDEGFASNTVDLSNVFADADSDALTYTASSSTESVATVAVSGTTLTYSGVSVGTTTITVTANDGKGGTVTDEFTVTINAAPVNNAPTVANAIADQTEIEGFRLFTVDLINVFTDVDEDALLFTAVSSNTSIASVSVSGFNLDISEEAIGTVTITVTAEDGRGGIATDEFSLSILEAAVPQEAEIPQGFSPNGDGVNDMWQVPNIENFPNNTVTIFDRQGNKVYQARGYNNADVSFEGLASSGAINKSQGLSDGVYYYIIDLGNGESRKGSIIIKQ